MMVLEIERPQLILEGEHLEELECLVDGCEGKQGRKRGGDRCRQED